MLKLVWKKYFSSKLLLLALKRYSFTARHWNIYYHSWWVTITSVVPFRFKLKEKGTISNWWNKWSDLSQLFHSAPRWFWLKMKVNFWKYRESCCTFSPHKCFWPFTDSKDIYIYINCLLWARTFTETRNARITFYFMKQSTHPTISEYILLNTYGRNGKNPYHGDHKSPEGRVARQTDKYTNSLGKLGWRWI